MVAEALEWVYSQPPKKFSVLCTGDHALLDDLLLFIGYFALNCPKNQAMLNWQQAGEEGVLQLLCTKMPFVYFSERRCGITSSQYLYRILNFGVFLMTGV